MITVTGATGHLGRLVIAALTGRGVPAAGITAAVRHPDAAADLAAAGVRVVPADYDDPSTLPAAFAGTDRLLLISSNAVGARVAGHANVIRAAAAAGVGLLAYTSILHADTIDTLLAADHLATEAALRAAGVPYALLRNGWYTENYTAQIPTFLATGTIAGSAGTGRVSAATRADYAAAAAAVLTTDGQAGAVYELAGDDAFTLPELAAEITRQTGTEIRYQDLPQADYAALLTSVGVPAQMAEIYADADRAIAAGHLYEPGGTVTKLTGRPTTPLADAVAAALT
jgi:NAD(P)H dehydrogenase (quinone)